jgi:hypothetical protein
MLPSLRFQTTGQQHGGCLMLQGVYNLVLLKMGEIIARNVELIEIVNKPLLLHLFCCLYYFVKKSQKTFSTAKGSGTSNNPVA